MQAAEAFGIDPDVYFAKSRESRMAMAAYVMGRDAVSAMRTYDEAKRRERKGKPKGK